MSKTRKSRIRTHHKKPIPEKPQPTVHTGGKTQDHVYMILKELEGFNWRIGS